VAILEQAPADPWIYTGGLENYPQLIERLALLRPLYGNGADTLRRVRDPWQVAVALDQHGLARPVLASDPDRLPVDGTWLRKRRRSAGGLQVSVWRGDDSAMTDTACETSADYYYQQHIEGLPCSAIYVAAGGQMVLVGVTEQLLGGAWAGQCKSEPTRADDFRYAGSTGPLPLDDALRDRFRQIGQALAAEFPLVGLFGVDCILADQVPWPIEVNPRYTASIEIIERASGVPLIGWHVEACCSGRLPMSLVPADGQFWGKAILFARQDLVIGDALSDYVAATPQRDAFPLFADIPTTGCPLSAGQPILTVFACGESLEEVRRELRSRQAETEAVVLSSA
jgi:predicted ATP-grasp superfamily ATP-dependent carboligase